MRLFRDPMDGDIPVAPDRVSQQAEIEYLRIRSDTALARKDAELRRLRAEVECLEIIKQRFEAIVENVPCWLFASAADGTITFMNNGFARFTGRPVGEALGHGWLNFVHPADIDEVRAALGKALVTGISRGATMRLLSHDGSYRVFRSTGTAVRDGNGKIIEWYGSLVQAGTAEEGFSII